MSSKQKRWESVEKTSITIEILIERYLSACRSAGMSPKTIRGYDEKLRRYLRQEGGTLENFTLNTVRQHLINLQNTKKWAIHPLIHEKTEMLSPTSIRNHGMVLTGFSKWLFEEGYTNTNILSGLKVPKANDISIEPLSDEEISRLVNCFDVNSEIGCRNCAIVWLFLDTGLRCAELVNLDKENMFLDNRRLKILGKGRKERILPFGHQTKRILEQYIFHLRPEAIYRDKVFLTAEGYPITENTVKKFIERAAKKVDIPRLHIHLLRHTFATRFVIQGGDTMWLQTLMGHERLETTQRYVKRGALQQIVLSKAISPIDIVILSKRHGIQTCKD
jgi:site-specific recombinase XerD